MKAILRHLSVAALVGTALAATACAPTVNTHGYRIDPAVVAQIQPGVTSREEVERLLGSPSSMSTFNDKSWYYVTQRTEQLTFYDTDVAAQDVLRIDFGGDGLVSDVNQRGLEMARNIEPAPEKTRTMGNELTVVQQFVGNIGRFNTEAPAGPGSPGGRGRAPGQ
jgi:outer membrane protein assembly factor BamE (lipoprotein component of BamABCDE complex)